MQRCPLVFLTTVRPVTLHTWPLGELCIPPGGPRQASPRRLASLATSNRDDSLFLCDRCCLSPVCCINLPANENVHLLYFQTLYSFILFQLSFPAENCSYNPTWQTITFHVCRYETKYPNVMKTMCTRSEWLIYFRSEHAHRCCVTSVADK